MSDFLGADEMLVVALRQAMRTASAELAAIARTTSDPLAVDALRVVRRTRHALDDEWLPAVDVVLGLHTAPMTMDEVIDPTQALADLRAAHLHGVPLAISAMAILHRWHEHPDGWLWDDQVKGGPNVGDGLFEMLADDPAAATAFLRRVAGDPPLLFLSAEDERLVDRLLAVGTSPANTDAATAGAILRPLIAWGRITETFGWGHDGATRNGRAYLAGAAAPWLAQFNRRRDDWGWTRRQADDTLRWLVGDAASMDRMLAELAAWQQRLDARPLTRPDGTVELSGLIDIATTLSQLERACRAVDETRGAAQRLWLDLALRAGGTVASALTPGGAVASMATSAVTTGVSDLARAKLDEWGVVPSEARVTAEAQERFGSRVTDTAVIAITAIVCQRVQAGALPPTAIDDLGRALTDDDDGDCATDAVETRLEGFVEGLRGSTDPATFNAMSAVLLAFANPEAVAEACE